MAKDAFIILGAIFTLIVVSFALGGLGSLSTGVSSLNLIPQGSGGSVRQSSYGNSVTPPVREMTEKERQAKIEKELKEAQEEVAIIQKQLEDIQTYGEESPYKGMVTLQKSRSDFSTTDVDREIIRLIANKKNTEKINISQWKIVSGVSNRQATVPKASYLIFPGNQNDEQIVVLSPGETAYIITGRSPIGLSFRVNKCMGYYTQFQSFNPGITRQCPRPSVEILGYERDTSIFIDNVCMDYVDRIPACTINTTSLPLYLSASCQDAILSEIGYGSCVDKHKNDADFIVPEWRLYLKRDEELWRVKRELIKVLDENGLTVDYYSY